MQQYAEVVGGGPVALAGGSAQVRLGPGEVAAAQQQRPEHAHGAGVALVRGHPVPGFQLGVTGHVGFAEGFVREIRIGQCGLRVNGASRLNGSRARLGLRPHKPPCLQQS